MRFVGSVPVLASMNSFRRPDQQTRRLRLWINAQDANLGRVLAEIGKNLVPLQILVVAEEHWGGVCRRPLLVALDVLLGILGQNQGGGQEQAEEAVQFHIHGGSIHIGG